MHHTKNKSEGATVMSSVPNKKSIQNYMVNFGPKHPAAHGVLRLILELDGEVVERSDPLAQILFGQKLVYAPKIETNFSSFFDRSYSWNSSYSSLQFNRFLKN